MLRARPLIAGRIASIVISAAREFTRRGLAGVTPDPRTVETPARFGLDQPFELPAKIREVQIPRGAATIIQ